MASSKRTKKMWWLIVMNNVVENQVMLSDKSRGPERSEMDDQILERMNVEMGEDEVMLKLDL